MRRNEKNSTVIVVANRPRFFRELLCRALATASETFQVTEISDDSQIGKTLKGQQADWVIVTSEEETRLPAAAESLLAAQPSLSAIAVSPDGARLAVHTASNQGRVRHDYDNISLAQLIAVLAAPHPVSN